MGPANGIPYDTFLSLASGAAKTQPQGDEIYMLYTGGTTGMPKGVMYPLMASPSSSCADSAQIGLPRSKTRPVWARRSTMVDANTAVVVVRTPLMHGTGCWLGRCSRMLGGTSCYWRTCSAGGGLEHGTARPHFANRYRRRCLCQTAPTRAGDRTRSVDTSSLKLMISSGAMFTTEVKRGLIEHVPELAIADILGSTEGGMGQSIMTQDTPASETAKFTLLPVAKYCSRRPGSRRAPAKWAGRPRGHGAIRLLQGPRKIGQDVQRDRRQALCLHRRYGNS